MNPRLFAPEEAVALVRWRARLYRDFEENILPQIVVKSEGDFPQDPQRIAFRRGDMLCVVRPGTKVERPALMFCASDVTLSAFQHRHVALEEESPRASWVTTVWDGEVQSYERSGMAEGHALWVTGVQCRSFGELVKLVEGGE
jgi:hypothetical protein